ncbi:sugar transferase [Hamadaea sp.]|uniref:sugar transferase n=1 Tax=Hamadaea sp. TaxID=2024425 RepID=UPI0025BA7FAA|nr:sugar transferase [Hamadaea sp.]
MAREDPGEVTTSLKKPPEVAGRTESEPTQELPTIPPAGDSPAQPTDGGPRTSAGRRAAALNGTRKKYNGVARSVWVRTRPRLARWHRPYILVLIVLDYVAATLGSYTAVTWWETRASTGLNVPFFDEIAYGALPLCWIVLLWGNGAYDRRRLGIGADEFKRVVRAGVAVLATVSVAAFGFRVLLSRWSVLTAVLGALIYMLILRGLARRALHFIRRRIRHANHRTLLVGTLQETLYVYKIVNRSPAAGLQPVAIHLTDGVSAARRAQVPIPVYTNRNIIGLVHEVGADTIAICGSANSEPGKLRELAWELEGSGVDLVVAPQITDIAGPRVHIRPIEGLPLLHVEEPTLSGVSLLAKNAMDRICAILGLIALLPIFAIIGLAIKITDPGPIFFRQKRIGHEGRTFRVWKFRTMYTDAEERLATLVDLNESDGLLFKMKDDPRVTPIGRFLRASSLDELPQLINVVLGEMSLVGPRPLPAGDDDFEGPARRRLLVRPGMTGLWQVSGRSDTTWEEAVRLDLYYVDNWSLAYDLAILWRTVGVVFARKGAY